MTISCEVPPHLHFEMRESSGFDEATGNFIGRYFPPSFEALNASYTSPAQFLSTMNRAYGRSIENPVYQKWRVQMGRLE